MKNDNLLDALIKVNKAPKSILDVEFQYKGCIFTDACNIIEHFGDTSNSSQEKLSTEYLTNALKALPLFSKYKDGNLSSLHPQILEILKCPTNSAEMTLVSATAWAKVICEICKEPSDARKLVFEEIENPKNDDIKRISIVGGILNCGHNDVISNGSFLVKIFDIICHALSTSSGHFFQVFQVFKTWSHRLKEIGSLSKEDERNLLTGGNTIHSANLVIFNNWENPIRGVPDHLEDTFTNILDFLEKIDADNFDNYINDLFQNYVDNASWKSKGKYRMLNVLIPRKGVSKLLENELSFGRCLSLSLSSNHLVSVGVTVYKTILKDITLEQWKVHFLQPLVDCLLDLEDNLVQSNANIYWIPTSVKMLPESGNTIFSTLTALNQSNENWQAKMNVLKNQRLLGHVNQLSPDQLLCVEEGLIHTKQEIRIASFSVLCLSNKRGTPPTNEEMQLISEFIIDNLTVSDASFRQVVKSNFVQVITRCRDFAVAYHRKLMKTLKARDHNTLIQNDQHCPMVLLITQLDHMMERLFKNLFPGANYQRLITCLELLNVFDACFFNFEANKGLNKGSANSDPKNLIVYVSENFELLNMYKRKQHCEAFLSCILYYMEDVRSNAFQLLKNFDQDHAVAEEVMMRTALELACSPKFAECESSALLFNLCIYWYSDSDKHWVNDLKSINLKKQYVILSNTIQDISGQILHRKNLLSQVLMQLYEKLIDQAVAENGKEFLNYSKSSPMHGILTALRACLPTELPSKILMLENASFLTSLIDAVSKSVTVMLSMFGGNKGSSEQAASFADMGIAIDSMIENTENDLSNNDIGEDYSISDEHSLILACIWLNLKSCSLIIAQIISSYNLSYENSYRCTKLLSDILTKCRHKGAMENAMFAMERVCSSLAANADQEIRGIPHKILEEVLSDLDESHSISLTRRSAGLPMLIQKIVSSEKRGIGGQTRKMLAITIEKLIDIAAKPVDDAIELFDMPQSHALHILRTLVHESSLSSDILKYCDKILICCVNRFSSNSWAIRNAALQLFGALVPRVVGQKKIRNEDSICNSITIDEFFTRYPALPKFLLTSLRQNTAALIHPSVVPLLVLFSRISLGAHNPYRNNDLIKQFKSAFNDAFSSSVINVRKLAAKAYVNFTSKDTLINEVQIICSQASCDTSKTNYVDACLYCVIELLNMIKTEYCELVDESYPRLVNAVKELTNLNNRNCCIKLNVIKIWKLLKLPEDDMCELKSKLFLSHEYSNIHPGFRELLFEIGENNNEIRHEDNNSQLKTKESCFQYISRLKSIHLNSNDVCRKVQLFLEENMGKDVMNGKIYEECNEVMLMHYNDILKDPELAMDILELSNGMDTDQQNRVGIIATTTSLMVQAVCFSSMMTQADFKMFFGDESVYVSMFSKMSEDIEKYSQPNKMETCRIHSSQSLKHLIPVFNERNIRQDFDPLIMYAFVKLANSAFVLLNDEDSQVREMITEFVSELKTNIPCHRYLSTVAASKKLVQYGLEQFSSCIEWFLPIDDVFFRPWVFDTNLHGNAEHPLHILRKAGTREYLFESGDGINVFKEEVGQNILYASVIKKWLEVSQKDNPQFKLNINVKDILEQTNSLVEYIENHSYVKDYSGDLWSNQGFLLLIRYYNILLILKEYPIIMNIGNYSGYAATPEARNITILLEYINKHFPHFIDYHNKCSNKRV